MGPPSPVAASACCGFGLDPSLYYVMELLHGLDLHRIVTRFGPQPAERVIMLLRQACRSLAEAHEYGLVHRDIKPANLFVTGLGLEYDDVKVLGRVPCAQPWTEERARAWWETHAPDLVTRRPS